MGSTKVPGPDNRDGMDAGATDGNAATRASSRKRTVLIVLVSIFIVFALVIAAIPFVLTSIAGNTGVRVPAIEESRVSEATTDVNGHWGVTNVPGPNASAVGFTFFEVLPGERKVTSGSTQGVTGSATVEGETLQSAEVIVDMNNLTTDSDVRDVSVRETILHTDEYPHSTFTVTQPADLSGVPGDGTVGTVELTGELTIMGQTNELTHTFDIARSGDSMIIGGDIPINRLDYGVETPELVAATIDEEGEVNVRVKLVQN